jgi:hypothetical protein
VKVPLGVALMISISMVIGGIEQLGWSAASWLSSAWITALAVGFAFGFLVGARAAQRDAQRRQRGLLNRIEANGSVASYICPLCGRMSYHPKDVENRYCSCCGSADGLLPKDCQHRRALRA